MWWLLLGAIFLAGVVITIDIIIKKVREHVKNKARISASNVIKAKIESKDYNSVNIGLYDESGYYMDNLKIEGESISDDVREGQVLTINV